MILEKKTEINLEIKTGFQIRKELDNADLEATEENETILLMGKKWISRTSIINVIEEILKSKNQSQYMLDFVEKLEKRF
jgi:ribose 5-phosphate isomerase RpiB